MKCPECGTEKSERPKKGPRAWRTAVEKDGKTWRVHECVNCHKVFVSIQMALSPRDAARWADAFEPTLELPGSTTGPSDTDNPLARLDDEPAS